MAIPARTFIQRFSSLIGLGVISFGPFTAAAQWITNTPLPDGYSQHSLVYYEGFLYQTGGQSSTGGVEDATNVFYAEVYNNGLIGSWAAAPSLPEMTYNHESVAVKGFLYVLGGTHYTLSNGFFTSDAIYFSQLNTNGSVGNWRTNHLPTPLDSFGACVWSNRIYIAGGLTDVNVTTSVRSAEIQADGNLGPWISQTPLPENVYAHECVANGSLYVIGGIINSGTAVSKKVYHTKINADGTLAGWSQTTSLINDRADLVAVAANGRVFAMGGTENASDPVNAVYNSVVNGDGSLRPWSTGFQLPQPLFYHDSAASPTHIFVSGGASYLDYQDTVYSFPLPGPPALTMITPQGSGTNGGFQLHLSSTTNTGFGFQASTNLTDWERIGWGFTGTNGLLFFQDTNAANFPRRFYRAYWPLP